MKKKVITFKELGIHHSQSQVIIELPNGEVLDITHDYVDHRPFDGGDSYMGMPLVNALQPMDVTDELGAVLDQLTILQGNLVGSSCDEVHSACCDLLSHIGRLERIKNFVDKHYLNIATSEELYYVDDALDDYIMHVEERGSDSIMMDGDVGNVNTLKCAKSARGKLSLHAKMLDRLSRAAKEKK